MGNWGEKTLLIGVMTTFRTGRGDPKICGVIDLVKLNRDRKHEVFGPQMVVKSKGKSPKISGKSRLVKYCSIWPDLWTFFMEASGNLAFEKTRLKLKL